MKPIVLVTAGIEINVREYEQLYLYKNYSDSIINAGGIPIIPCTKNKSMLNELISISQGLVLTGGGDILPSKYGQLNRGKCYDYNIWRDELEIDICKEFIKNNKPILGICRGMQIINIVLGGTLIQDISNDIGIEHKYDSLHSVNSIEGYWINKLLGDTFIVNSYHHQAIEQLGDSLIPIAFSENGKIIEAIQHENLPIIGVQWHPERMIGDNRIRSNKGSMEEIFKYLIYLAKTNVNIDN